MHLTNWRDFLKLLKFEPSAHTTARRPRHRQMAATAPAETLELRVMPSATTALSVAALTPPTGTATSATSVTYRVTFDRDVTGVDANDFEIVTSGSIQYNSTIIITPINGTNYAVTINGLSGTGDVRLDLVDNDTILDAITSGIPPQPNEIPLGGSGLYNGSFQGSTYHLLQALPRVTAIDRVIPTVDSSYATSISYRVTFSAPVTGVDAGDFGLSLTGALTIADPIDVTGSGSTYTVTVSGLTGNGSVGLNLVDDNSIHDLQGNPLTAPGLGLTFAPPQTVNVGGTANAIASGDLNLDGITDIVTIDSLAGTVAVTLGNGDGTFQFPVLSSIFPSGSVPRAVAVRDLNGDGRPDVVVVNKNSNTISLFYGNGDGTLQLPTALNAGNNPSAVVLGFHDGNGLPDIAVTNELDDNVTVQLNSRGGSFGLDTSLITGQGPSGIAAGDLNADGFQDLVVANKNSNSVSVFLSQNGDGFHPSIVFSVGDSPSGIAVADLNEDGKFDIVTANKGSADVSVLLGNGDGTFQAQTNFFTGLAPVSVMLTDINGDGHADAIVAAAGSNELSVLPGTGNGTFQTQQSFSVGSGPASVAIVDVDRDGRPDALTADGGGTGVTVLRNATLGDFNGQVYVRFNSAPSITSPGSVDVLENIPISTVLQQITATDTDTPSQTFTYSMTGSDAEQFNLDPLSGIITFKLSPDYEAPADANVDNVYEVDVSVNDGYGGTASRHLLINVLPVNDNLPIFSSSSSANFQETTPASEVVLNVYAVDQDLPAQIITYSLSGTDAALFSIDSMGQIRFLASPDYEAPQDLNGDNVYEFTVTANDGNGGLQPQDITINVRPVDEFTPTFNSPATVSIPENTPLTTVILDVNVTDADLPAQPLEYTLLGIDSQHFSIDSSTGEIRFLISPDFELPADQDQDNVYQLRVEVRAGFSESLISQDLTITVLAVNDFLPVFTSASSTTIDENTPATTVLLDAAATDGDLPAQTVTYSLSGTDAALFSIDTVTGEVRFLNAPDYEAPTDLGADNVYDFTIIASDGNGGTETQNATVTVVPVNDNVLLITSSPSANFDENTPASTVVLDVSATDADLPASSLFYSLSGPDSAFFSIDSATGEIRFLASPDFEVPLDQDQNNIYELMVMVAESGELNQSQDLAITVLPVNDNAPVFDSPGSAVVDENISASSAVLTVAGIDRDQPAQTISYVLTGPDASLFSINSLGEIRFISSPNFESPADLNGDNIYQFSVVATDNGTPGLSSTQAIAITVANVNETPTATGGTLQLDENTTATDALVAGDPDQGTTLTFSIITPPAQGVLILTDSHAGAYTYTPTADYVGPDSFTFRVTDGLLFGETVTVSITVNSTNSAPAVNAASFVVKENSINGTIVGSVIATDADIVPGPASDVLTFAITGGNTSGALSIDPASGELRVANSSVLNYEVLQQIALQVTVTDLAGEATTADITVNISNVNEPLIITLPESIPVYRTNGTPQIVDPEATVYDEDLTRTDYRGGLLVVTVTNDGAADPHDRLGVLVEGTGDGKISLVSQYIVYGSPLNIIGTIASGLDGGPLVINLTSFANEESIGALLQAITFYNTGGKPEAGTRTITFQLTDGPAENSGIKTKQVEFVTVSANPTVTLPSGDLILARRSPPTALDAAATVIDRDSPSLINGRLTVNSLQGANRSDRLRIVATGGISVSGKDVLFNGQKIGRLTQGKNSITVDFNTTSATPAAAQALLRAITFSTTANRSGVGVRQYLVKLTDGGGGQQSISKTVRVS